MWRVGIFLKCYPSKHLVHIVSYRTSKLERNVGRYVPYRGDTLEPFYLIYSNFLSELRSASFMSVTQFQQHSVTAFSLGRLILNVFLFEIRPFIAAGNIPKRFGMCHRPLPHGNNARTPRCPERRAARRVRASPPVSMPPCCLCRRRVLTRK